MKLFLRNIGLPAVIGIALGSAGISIDMWQFWLILVVYLFKEEFLK